MKSLLFALLTVCSVLVWADGDSDTRIETIQLNHRLAVEVLPEVQAFLPKDVTARAFNDVIILKAQPDVIHEIKQLIHKLDTPLQRLKITVLRTNERLSDQQRSQIDAEILVDDEGTSSGVSVQTWSTQNTNNKDQQYEAQGIAGRPILISMGQEIPQQEQYLVLRADGDLTVQSNTNYLDIFNGFQAVARILPNHHATVDIHPIFSHFSKQSGVIDRSQIITSISGPVGVWLEVGSISNEKNIEKQGVTRYHSHQETQQILYLKVEQF
ncbi:MAG: hypothetical protein OEY48_05245 [Gammaproteobacteria bacterium]|nr:hypothetical protein [Gammaproteobacteria bacterium]MDH5592236.1 hypothetical protein [Gammaproteobacteria bacterium]